MPDPLVSICIPCYNASAYVATALDSALAQTWTPLEIIVVNDGSTDESSEILGRYQERGIKVIHQDNQGQCVAANRAWQEASGDYIKFFDADDLMSPGMIERQMAKLNGREDAVASAEWGRFYGNDLASFHSNPEEVWRDMPATDWMVEAWKDARPMMQCALWLIPRAILDKSGGWDARLSLINDFEFFARVLCHAEEVLFTPGATLYYRSGISGSLSGRKSDDAIRSAFRSISGATGHLLAKRDDSAARRSCANVFQEFIYNFYPRHPELLKEAARRVSELGGSSLGPVGPPNFHRLRRIVGWKAARHLQNAIRTSKYDPKAAQIRS